MAVKVAPRRTDTSSLNGTTPDTCAVAVVLVDVINDFGYPRGTALLRHALSVAPKIAALKAAARAKGVPCIYANDNFGRWHAEFSAQVTRCLAPRSRGREFVAQLVPEAVDYSILKPKHSAFYETCLDLLLRHLGAKTLVICGLSTESCVTFTCHDAHVRGYKVIVPADATAGMSPGAHSVALQQLRRSVDALTPLTRNLAFTRTRAGVSVRVKSSSKR